MESSVFLGTATQIVVRLQDHVPLTVLVPNADEEQRTPPGGRRPGGLSWAPEHIHVVRDSEAAAAITSITKENNDGK